MRLGATRLGVLAAIVGVLLTVGLLPAFADSGSPPTPSYYYVSLGDSLANGTQPDSNGHNHATDQGNVDVTASVLQRSLPGLQVVKLGCGGTSGTVISGTPCNSSYGSGSQLQQAEAFLRAHFGQVPLVTVQIGDNDVERCIGTGGIDYGCVNSNLAAVGRHLPTIVRRLRAAGGPSVTILGIADYDQFLAYWLNGSSGRRVARDSIGVLTSLSRTMSRAYRASGALFADAGRRFETTDMRHMVPLAGHGQVPLDVQRVCRWTWACSGAPINFNDHAKSSGYHVIARAALDAIGPMNGNGGAPSP